ncbi:hypothetical protein ILUMI_05838 [Ignelater luminosus]|uniref:DNA polymerase alpha subunit B n=1 Tax=Ignelater luminosus TaxID=2038154 RepID=A0A8K0DAE0_IGNLU|nr:hypothetical protein ILUMI_05838 [Ignelater luminosus]
MGPFLDESHQNISDAAMAESFDSFFETLIGCVMTPLEGLNVQVVLLPSQKDVHHHVVFPTPPYILKKKYSNLHCLSDPVMLNIEGLIIGCTTTDILLHLGKEEVCSSSQSGDRMSRLASHLISQQSFYPLFPADKELCVDHELLEQHAVMDVIPHILMVPSNLRYFMKQINGCTVINPERLTKGYVGGTFCQIQVFPSVAGEPLTDNIVAKVVRI